MYKKIVKMRENFFQRRQKVVLRVARWSGWSSKKLITIGSTIRKFRSGLFNVRPFWDLLRFLFYLVKTRNISSASAVSTFSNFHGFNLIPGALFTIAIVLLLFLTARFLLMWAVWISPFVFAEAGNGANSVGDFYLYLVDLKKADIEKVRNIGLIVIGPLGFLLLTWRTWTASKQAGLAETGLNVDRFRKGCEMLTDDHFTARHAGVITLRELAVSRPKEYEVLVLDVLTNFLRTPDKKGEETPQLVPRSRPDAKAAFDTVIAFWQRPSTRARYCRDQKMLQLSGLNLKSFHMIDVCLRNIDFRLSVFTHCHFDNTDLYGASFRHTKFRQCSILGSKLEKTHFEYVEALGTTFKNCNWDGAIVRSVEFGDEEVIRDIKGGSRVGFLKSSIDLDDLKIAWLSDESGHKPFKNTENCSPAFSCKAYRENGTTKLRITQIEEAAHPL